MELGLELVEEGALFKLGTVHRVVARDIPPLYKKRTPSTLTVTRPMNFWDHYAMRQTCKRMGIGYWWV